MRKVMGLPIYPMPSFYLSFNFGIIFAIMEKDEK